MNKLTVFGHQFWRQFIDNWLSRLSNLYWKKQLLLGSRNCQRQAHSQLKWKMSAWLYNHHESWSYVQENCIHCCMTMNSWGKSWRLLISLDFSQGFFCMVELNLPCWWWIDLFPRFHERRQTNSPKNYEVVTIFPSRHWDVAVFFSQRCYQRCAFSNVWKGRVLMDPLDNEEDMNIARHAKTTGSFRFRKSYWHDGCFIFSSRHFGMRTLPLWLLFGSWNVMILDFLFSWGSRFFSLLRNQICVGFA